jgi:hypothetical protein
MKPLEKLKILKKSRFTASKRNPPHGIIWRPKATCSIGGAIASKKEIIIFDEPNKWPGFKTHEGSGYKYKRTSKKRHHNIYHFT